jgi:acetyl-CoA C-acetyltransferase
MELNGMSDPARRIPVIIGVGQINDRPARDEDGCDSLQLMEAAARAADADAGGGFLAQADWLGIVRQLSFPSLDATIPDLLPAALGINPAHVEQSEIQSGDSPIKFLNDAANAIGEGTARIAIVVGGEALRTASRRPDGGGIGRGRPTQVTAPLHVKYGLRTPIDIYPLYENAARAAYGQTLAEAQAETGVIWSNFSKVASSNPAAWIRTPRTPGDIITPTADNRPIAFPYTKLMVANASVNQGAALLVTSLAVAREAGIAENRIIYIGRGAAAHESNDPLDRVRWDRSPSMQVSLQRALAQNNVKADALHHIELYSCFPCVPKMARRVLGLPAETPFSLFGGLTFGGGPIGNYMTHAAASMVEKLRAFPGDGLLFANGGYATHNHTILLTTRPQPTNLFPQDYHFQDEADAMRGKSPPLVDGFEGTATIETYSVIYDRGGQPSHGVILSATPDGRRAIARVATNDTATIAALTSGHAQPVGMKGTLRRVDQHSVWSML